jgi:coatomer subunit beta
LDRLLELQEKYPVILQDSIMDILRGLTNSSLEIREKILKISLDLVSTKNSVNVLGSLKKEILSIGEDSKNGQYKQILVKSIHTLSLKYNEIADNSVFLIDYIGDSYCGVDVVLLLRDLIEKNEKLKEPILKRLTNDFSNINSTRVIKKLKKVFRTVLWIIGDYCNTKDQLINSLTSIKESILNTSFKKEKTENEIKINQDGTYGSNLKEIKSNETEVEQKTLRELIITGNFYLSSVLASTFTKIGVKVSKSDEFDNEEKNKTMGEVFYL